MTTPLSALIARAHDLLTLGRLDADATVSDALCAAADDQSASLSTLGYACLALGHGLIAQGESAKAVLLTAWKQSRSGVLS